jgi:hypothetical protein
VVEESALKMQYIDPSASVDENPLEGRISLVPLPPELYGRKAGQ